MAANPELIVTQNDQRMAAKAATAEAAAAAWLARRDAGLSPQETMEFQRWFAADPLHAAAWRELLGTWEALDRPRRAGAADAMIRELSSRSRQRWTLVVASGAMAVAACWIFVIVPRFSVGGEVATAEISTTNLVRLETERRTLADGSVVELGTGAEIEVDFSPEVRAVRLRRGRAHFAVTKNPLRPFVVSVDTAAVRAVGTAFLVRAGEHGADVVVTEGTVGVSRPAMSTLLPTLVSAGHRTSVGNDLRLNEPPQVIAVTEAELARLQAWRAPRLKFTGAALDQVVAALNRENATKLVIGDPALSRMKLNGVLCANDPAGLVRLLEVNYAVHAERDGTDRIVLSKKLR